MPADRIELPLFPLGTVLFPGGVLPLKVFELRYQEMTKRCLRDGTPFGVCLIREGREVGEPAVPVGIGCTARITDWEMPHPNLFHLKAVGGERFRVIEHEAGPLGLIRCQAELLREPASTDQPDPECRRLLAALIERFGAESFPAPIALDDAAWVSWRLAEVLPLAAGVRQQLLETEEPAARFAAIRSLLAQAAS